MKKQNLMIVSVFVGILMLSLVSAGLFSSTGHALKIGERITDASSLKVSEIGKSDVTIGGKIYSKGETFTDSGKTYEVKAIEKKKWFFGSDKVVIEEVESVETCTDSDGGLNYYEKGRSSGMMNGVYNSVEYDVCRDDFLLDEFYCVGNELKSNLYECPNGCEDGACVGEKPKPIPSEVTYEGVLKMLNSCEFVGSGDPKNAVNLNCNDICLWKNKKCVLGGFSMLAMVERDTQTLPIECDSKISHAYQTLVGHGAAIPGTRIGEEREYNYTNWYVECLCCSAP